MRGHHRLLIEKTPHNIRLWTAAEVEKLKVLFNEGYSDAEIGAPATQRVPHTRCNGRLLPNMV